MNLSSIELNEHQKSVLQKGLKFCPTPTAADKGKTKLDLDKFFRSIRLSLKFEEEPQGPSQRLPDPTEPYGHKSRKLPSTYNPPVPSHLEHVFNLIQDETLKHDSFKSVRYNNLSKDEYQAISDLRLNTQIVINQQTKGLQ